jgi:hypothetical protein
MKAASTFLRVASVMENLLSALVLRVRPAETGIDGILNLFSPSPATCNFSRGASHGRLCMKTVEVFGPANYYIFR